MQALREFIKTNPDQSFHFIHFEKMEDSSEYWHFHPESEIVFIPHGPGQRYIGNHIGRYETGELVWINSNVPHMSYSYGATHAPDQYVLQMREDFATDVLPRLPEYQSILQFFKQPVAAVVFGETTQRAVETYLKRLPGADAMDRWIYLTHILQILAQATDVEYIKALASSPAHRDARLQVIYQLVAERYQEDISTHDAAQAVHLSLPAFCRFFKKCNGRTFTSFLQAFRIDQACQLLDEGLPVNQAAADSGFFNLSHFNRTFKSEMGCTPTQYQKRFEKVPA